jgi:hypothetical protein
MTATFLIRAKIDLMKAQLPHHFDKLSAPPEHYSYQRHRRQRTNQIILPVILSAIVLAAMIVLVSVSTFNQGGDVGRWAAISTIWVIIPMLVGGLVVLAILGGLIYLMARALTALPYYTGIAQDYVYLARGYIIRVADMAVKPILALNGWLETAKSFLERMKP